MRVSWERGHLNVRGRLSQRSRARWPGTDGSVQDDASVAAQSRAYGVTVSLWNSWGFLRQRGRVRGPASDPCPKGHVGSVAGGCHQEPARGGSPAATQVEGLRAGLAKQDVRLRRIHPDDEVLSVNPDSHVAAEEKGDAAEHLLLDEPWSTCERLPDPRGLRLRIRHRSREVLSAHETWRRLATQFAIAGIFRKNSSLVNWRIMKSVTSAREMR